MLELVIAEKAEQNLIDIGEYTEFEWGQAQRKKYIKKIVDRFHWLASHPELGKNRSDIEEGDFSYHEGKHQIFYTFDESILNITAVLHERMDFERHL